MEAYMGAAAGNGTKAARLAGYSAKTAGQQASRLLKKANVQAGIETRVKKQPGIATREDRQRFWTQVANGEGKFAKAKLTDRLKASELLGKSQADFVDRTRLEIPEGVEFTFSLDNAGGSDLGGDSPTG